MNVPTATSSSTTIVDEGTGFADLDVVVGPLMNWQEQRSSGTSGRRRLHPIVPMSVLKKTRRRHAA